jgi:hypothetical protein
LKEKVAAPVYKCENTAVGIRHANHVALTSPTSGGRSVGIVRSRTQATEFSFLIYYNFKFDGKTGDNLLKIAISYTNVVLLKLAK